MLSSLRLSSTIRAINWDDLMRSQENSDIFTNNLTQVISRSRCLLKLRATLDYSATPSSLKLSPMRPSRRACSKSLRISLLRSSAFLLSSVGLSKTALHAFRSCAFISLLASFSHGKSSWIIQWSWLGDTSSKSRMSFMKARTRELLTSKVQWCFPVE